MKPYRPPRATRGSRRPTCERCHKHQPIWLTDEGLRICGFCAQAEPTSAGPVVPAPEQRTFTRRMVDPASAGALRGDVSPHAGEWVERRAGDRRQACPSCGWAGGGRCLRCATYGTHGSTCAHVQADGSVRP